MLEQIVHSDADLNVTERFIQARRIHLLSVTLIESSQNLLETLGAELLYPAERIISERDPEGLDAVVDLVDAQIGLRQVLYIVRRFVEF